MELIVCHNLECDAEFQVNTPVCDKCGKEHVEFKKDSNFRLEPMWSLIQITSKKDNARRFCRKCYKKLCSNCKENIHCVQELKYDSTDGSWSCPCCGGDGAWLRAEKRVGPI